MGVLYRVLLIVSGIESEGEVKAIISDGKLVEGAFIIIHTDWAYPCAWPESYTTPWHQQLRKQSRDV